MNEDYIPNGGSQASFDLEKDFVPAPILPAGTYEASIISSTMGSAKTGRPFVLIHATILDSGLTFPGSEKEIDGQKVRHTIYLPVEADRAKKWKDETNAHEGMTRMMVEALNALDLGIRTAEQLTEVITQGELVGQRVAVQIVHTVKDDGRVFPEVKSMKVV